METEENKGLEMEFQISKSYDDEAELFQSKIEKNLKREGTRKQRAAEVSSRKVSERKPEDVKFRTREEQRASKKLQQGQTRNASQEEKVNVDSFEFLGLIGEGAFGKVFMAKKKKSNKFYAIKMIQKSLIMKANKQQEVFRERQALIALDHPNIVKMYWSFDVRLKIMIKALIRTKSTYTSYLI